MSGSVVVTDHGAVVVADDVRSEDPTPAVDVDRWGRLAAAALAASGARGELTLTFVDRSEISALNAEYMGQDGPTDVLSFPLDEPDDDEHDDEPGDEEYGDEHGDDEPAGGPDGSDDVPVLLGDVVVCPSVADEQFAEHAGTLDDEIALLVVHGVLHVLGHDHAEPDETATMRERELDLLSRLHWDGPPPVAFRQTHPD